MHVLNDPRFAVGKKLEFENYQLASDGFEHFQQAGQIEAIAGGGFRGGVLLLDDSVLKTGVPVSAKGFFRALNTKESYFVPAHDEAQAQADHIASRLLRLIAPRVLESGIYVPKSLGYTDLGDRVGFAQHIERVNGRIATFEPHSSDNRRIVEVREEIWEVIGKQYGFEHAAQVHPNNPFGKPNIWVGEDDLLIWLDWLPAFSLKGRAWPNPLVYDFHRDAQSVFGKSRPFDQINVGMARRALDSNKINFTGSDLLQVELLLGVYENLLTSIESYDPKNNNEPRGARYINIANLGLSATAETAVSLIPEVVKSRTARKQWLETLRNFEELRKSVLKKTFLRGMSQANGHGLVDDQELEHTLDFLPSKDVRFYTSMQVGYFALSRLSDFIAAPFYVAAASSGENAPNRLVITAMAHQLVPNVLRGVGTYTIGKRSKRDLKSMAIHSVVPLVGTYTAVPYQITREYGHKADKIKHYNKRSIVARVSSLLPSGGWGSDAEEKLWNGLDKVKLRKFVLSQKLGSLAFISGL